MSEQQLSEIKVVGYSMGGMIATRLLKFNTLPISHLIYLNSAAKITPDGSMLARLFTSDSKRDILKDEINAVKNLPQYILDKTIFAQKKMRLNYFNSSHQSRQLSQIFCIRLMLITYQILKK